MKLTKCQDRAMNIALESKDHITISGPAGCGKSFLTEQLLKEFGSDMGIALAAPTHQAKNVLQQMAKHPASTLHSLLRIHPETYDDVMIFDQSKMPDLDHLRVLMVDEASMVDRDLKKIMIKSIPAACRIIGIGDKFQIQPVRHNPGELSPMFTDFDLVEMEEVVRQSADSPIIQVASDIRNGGWFSTKWDSVNKRGVMQVPSVTKMMEVYLRKIQIPEDLMNYRLLAFTNDTVNKMNKVIRKHVYNTDEPFVGGEFLVMQQPVVEETVIGRETVTETLLNNGEYVRIQHNSIQQKTKQIDLPGVDKFDVEMADLIVTSEEFPDGVPFSVLWGDGEENLLSYELGESASYIKGLKRGHAQSQAWKQFWAVKKMFTQTKSLGASTIHKSQGTTVTGVGVYTGDMSFADFTIQSQLGYVACTRATDWVLWI